MTGQTHPNYRYLAESSSARIIRPLDEMTLIYQRRSGITHIVADPVPQILHAMGDAPCDVIMIAERLAAEFDLGDGGLAETIIAERLEELAALGLVERVHA